jgi:hypothetical protein
LQHREGLDVFLLFVYFIFWWRLFDFISILNKSCHFGFVLRNKYSTVRFLCCLQTWITVCDYWLGLIVSKKRLTTAERK